MAGGLPFNMLEHGPAKTSGLSGVFWRKAASTSAGHALAIFAGWKILALSAGGFFVFVAAALIEPLAAYTLSLALFGLPHVLSELRYVDRRFGRRLSRQILLPMAVLLPVIIGLRALTVFHLIPAETGFVAELSGVVLLALLSAQGFARQKILGVAVAGSLGLATFIAPFTTAVSLSILHNLTPLGFLWQIAPPHRRIGVMSLASSIFIGLPLLVATGIPRHLIGSLFGEAARIDPLGAGPLAEHLFVYIPQLLLDSQHAVDFFSACVVAQGAHYMAVILILPLALRRIDPEARGLLRWPKGVWFAGLCAAASMFFLVRSLGGFAEARSLYGIIASLHAWLEIPVLIAVFGSGDQQSDEQRRCVGGKRDHEGAVEP